MMSAPNDELVVWHERARAGTLRRGDGDRLSFRYHADWLARRDAWPISLSLPLQAEPHDGVAAGAFFANLLPEAAARERVCARLGISRDNDFELLRAIGGECAGALSLLEPEAAPTTDPAEYQRISARTLDQLAQLDAVVPLVMGGATTRLSLAGAQDKLPVYVDGDGIWLPLHGSPSTHILKVGSTFYRHLPENEALVTWFAQELLGPDDVVHVELRPRRHSTLLLVRRYDRSTGPEPWQVARLHQEDLCQALALPPTRKYQGEGGPSLADCVALLRRHAREPLVDTRRLLRWAIFNLIAGNADGHAKNLSLLYRDAVPQLAPFYDLVCTRRYAQIDRSLAQSLGGQADPDHIAAKHFAALAEELSIARRWLLDLVAELLDAAEPALKRATARFREAAGDHTVLRSIPPLIRKQCKRTRQLLNMP